ncbi:MAG: hypothetical protein A2010_11565 [Nitrospirae bacterium GWD2_57_9]|nr:MAG: hypothetical protein A2010_11565 [Nitrospirae bacterium GWD2_57_9]
MNRVRTTPAKIATKPTLWDTFLMKYRSVPQKAVLTMPETATMRERHPRYCTRCPSGRYSLMRLPQAGPIRLPSTRKIETRRMSTAIFNSVEAGRKGRNITGIISTACSPEAEESSLCRVPAISTARTAKSIEKEERKLGMATRKPICWVVAPRKIE